MKLDFLSILKQSPEAMLPIRAHQDDAGLDLYNLEDVFLHPHQGKVVKTGISIELPPGYVALVLDRSSLAKKGIKTMGGVIDSGYRGEIHVVLWNLSLIEISLRKKERIAQLVIFPIATPVVKEVAKLNETERGEKGFGSSGA